MPDIEDSDYCRGREALYNEDWVPGDQEAAIRAAQGHPDETQTYLEVSALAFENLRPFLERDLEAAREAGCFE